MPFPFLPGGAILAIVVLVGALTIFGLALTAMDRAAGRTLAGLRGSMLGGVVTGWRGWAGGLSDTARRPLDLAAGSGSGIEIVDLDGSATPPD